MEKEKFLELLKFLGKEKKEEVPPKSPAEIKARRGKTFYEIWMEGRDE